jgi:hypothetical protein
VGFEPTEGVNLTHLANERNRPLCDLSLHKDHTITLSELSTLTNTCRHLLNTFLAELYNPSRRAAEKAVIPKNIIPSNKLYRSLKIIAADRTSTDLLKIEKRCYTDLYRKRDPYPGKNLLLANMERKTTCILHTSNLTVLDEREKHNATTT